MYSAYFSGTGALLPDKIVTNRDLEKLVDTSDEWIVQRTGIRQRRMAADGQNTSDLALGAARQALQAARVAPGDLDAVIVATVTGDTICPAAAVYVQGGLGASNACAFDISAACTGFVYGVVVAGSFIQSGLYQNVLLVGAETLTRFVDFKDRGSCILFGDGAGAAVISRAPDGSGSKLIDSLLRADGKTADLISIPAGGCRLPASPQTVEARQHYLQLQGKEVFKFATKAMVDLIETALARNRLQMSDLQLIIPHQVNYRIIEAALKKLDLPEERLYLNLERYGNTSSASVPIALHEASQEGRLKRGDLVLLVAFGAGMTWGYNLMRW